MQSVEYFLAIFAKYAWGPWLLFLLLGGGCFFLFYSRFLPFLHFRHAIEILSGKFDKLKPGSIVSVPFGREKEVGVIWDKQEETSRKFKLKTVIE